MRKRRGRARGEDGQAMVESAIVIPMYVFLILGLLQLGLIHQARLMTKYAAYKAVRAGAVHNANVREMRRTALWTLLPLISKSSSGTEVITPVTEPSDYLMKWFRHGLLDGMMLDAPIFKHVEVAICGPTQAAIQWKTNEVDFDDPQINTANVANRDDANWKKFDRTKLRIQVTYNYRMPIPFANQIFHNIALGKDISRALYMGGETAIDRMRGMQRRMKAWQDGLMMYDMLGEMGIYIWPIRASYSMRMQSNLYKSNLPANDSSGINGDCEARWL
ncbi:MAG: TadE/TadG family type IV pilus assembly protein [Deltaproteobacteria bacterium]|nr:TadE/TadG family type IV pilus assembly protein [Deltaproteobacteria bacterium]